ncbi:hypothetical protein P171DRAFT_434445 [Karstenula rhodostoma CBS 690.94]|uniref:Uncharacterized protein n=1 Tax=Karstenula rhodostoma CBS 690.94 TaxID=1392251 RepID=A0A9P4PDG4_9PLEO|nr:hypothetical protein P171DRAFT_434445 [Karstenula rhodostoma CBS 690.94]
MIGVHLVRIATVAISAECTRRLFLCYFWAAVAVHLFVCPFAGYHFVVRVNNQKIRVQPIAHEMLSKIELGLVKRCRGKPCIGPAVISHLVFEIRIGPLKAQALRSKS